MNDESAGKAYTLPKSYLCEIKEIHEYQKLNVVSLLKDVLEDGEDKHAVGLLCELHFLNCRLDDEFRKYDLTDCEKETEEEYIITETELFVFRTILLNRHTVEKELSQKNYSVKNN